MLKNCLLKSHTATIQNIKLWSRTYSEQKWNIDFFYFQYSTVKGVLYSKTELVYFSQCLIHHSSNTINIWMFLMLLKCICFSDSNTKYKIISMLIKKTAAYFVYLYIAKSTFVASHSSGVKRRHNLFCR